MTVRVMETVTTVWVLVAGALCVWSWWPRKDDER